MSNAPTPSLIPVPTRSRLRRILNISLKNAVNSLLTNSAFLTATGNWHTLNTRAGWLSVLYLAGSTIVAREGIVWLPKILAWSQSIESSDIVGPVDPPAAKSANV